MITNIDQIVVRSVSYIADVTHNSKVDVMETWIKAYTKQQDKLKQLKTNLATIETELKLYKATIAKSKNKHSIMNVKWHDPKMYAMFVLRWS